MHLHRLVFHLRTGNQIILITERKRGCNHQSGGIMGRDVGNDDSQKTKHANETF